MSSRSNLHAIFKINEWCKRNVPKFTPGIHTSKWSRDMKCIARVLISSRLTFARRACRSCVTTRVRAILNVDTTCIYSAIEPEFCKKNSYTRAAHVRCLLAVEVGGVGEEEGGEEDGKSIRDTHYFLAIYTQDVLSAKMQVRCQCIT